MIHADYIFMGLPTEQKFKSEIDRMLMQVASLGRELLERDLAEVAGKIVDASAKLEVPVLGKGTAKIVGAKVEWDIPFSGGGSEVFSMEPSPENEPDCVKTHATVSLNSIKLLYDKKSPDEIKSELVTDLDCIQQWLDAIKRDVDYYNATKFDVIYKAVESKAAKLQQDVDYEKELNS